VHRRARCLEPRGAPSPHRLDLSPPARPHALLRRRRARRPLPPRARRDGRLPLAPLRGRPRLDARLRRRLPPAPARLARRRGGLRRALRRHRAAPHGPAPRRRPQPHGPRRRQRLVDGRPRERPLVGARPLLRRRLDPGQGRAPPQGAGPRPRRSVRRRPRARRAAPRPRRRQLLHRLLRPPLPRRAALGPAHPRPPPRRAHRARRRRRRRPARIVVYHHRAREAGPAQRDQPRGRRRARPREGGRQAPPRRALRRLRAGPHPRRRQRAPLQRHPRRPAQLRSPRGAPRSPGLPPRLLARRRRGDQLPPLLRHQRPRRHPHGGRARLRGLARPRLPPRRRGAGHRPAHRSPRRALHAVALLRAAARALPRGAHRRREDPRGGRAHARPLGRRRYHRL